MDFSLQQMNLNRRHCIALAAVLASSGIYRSVAADTAPPVRPSLLVLGDSLSAEYGLRRGTGWVALLEQNCKLKNPGRRGQRQQSV